MKHSILALGAALGLLVGGVGLSPTPALAEQFVRGAGSGGGEHLVPVGQTPRYDVTSMQSRTEDDPNSVTVITITNTSSQTCDVSVDWFNIVGTLIETTSYSLFSGESSNHCSRTVQFPITECLVNGTMTFHQGFATVNSTTTPSECGKIQVEARVYLTGGESSSEVPYAISNPKVIKHLVTNRGE